VLVMAVTFAKDSSIDRYTAEKATFKRSMTEKILTFLVPWITAIISHIGYPGVALLMAIESACIPLPSEIIMPFAGYLVYTGRFSLFWVATAGAIGCNLGSAVAYWVGAYGGRPLVEKYGSYILLDRRDLDRTTKFFVRFGPITVLLARLLPVVRTFIALPAGIARMPQLKFHIYTFVGSWPWCFVLAYAGMKLGNAWNTDPRLKNILHESDAVVVLLLVAGIGWFIWSHWKRRTALNEA
jgi:membrane protein DedA with SNARE-associated domain